RVLGRFFGWLAARQEAEDLAQEVFLRLYRSRLRYQPTAKFTTWLFHISQNVARNALRSRRRRPFVRLGSLTAPDVELSAHRFLDDRSQAPERPIERPAAAGAGP